VPCPGRTKKRAPENSDALFFKTAYAIVMAWLGQSQEQAPQSMHSSVTLAFSFSMTTEPFGHTSTHLAHPLHFSKSTLAGIVTPLKVEYR
jgi:hypothetical protein